jgi:hypothetical protein
MVIISYQFIFCGMHKALYGLPSCRLCILRGDRTYEPPQIVGTLSPSSEHSAWTHRWLASVTGADAATLGCAKPKADAPSIQLAVHGAK